MTIYLITLTFSYIILSDRLQFLDIYGLASGGSRFDHLPVKHAASGERHDEVDTVSDSSHLFLRLVEAHIDNRRDVLLHIGLGHLAGFATRAQFNFLTIGKESHEILINGILEVFFTKGLGVHTHVVNYLIGKGVNALQI